ncbi:acetyl-CoA acetyltransferase [Achromobacter ruhlandii]|uniref:acetyl-CoA acetyltransferase n=1 Tax=Achromobacter ruhlandii TaxID=72557 RepID=UPI001EED5EA0|nr:acetyl-CoA acetyltransferase [Achromobacter ruhlandii]MCZ8398858.1 acetyl-CoA acetyltransferase [Achromobacter ruhlandii]
MFDHSGVSIVGSGHTPFGKLDALNLEQLIVMAANEAIEDAGVDPAEIDAIFLGHFNAGLVPDAFPASLVHQAHPALRFKPATRCENACASGSAAIHAGLRAIQSGAAGTVLVIGVEKMTSRTTPEVTEALACAGYKNDPRESAMSFPQQFARLAEQYADRYDDPLPVMAAIAAKNHANALRNPLAQLRRELDADFCNTISERNPMIASPLRMTDCSPISDGAAAVILTCERRAPRYARQVRFRAATQVNDMLPLEGRDLLAFEGPHRAMQRAYSDAGVQLQDLDFAEVHDCFTIAELLIYEAMGLAAPGKGHRVLAEGTVRRDGDLPVNLSGGLKAKGHPVGATGVSMHALAYRQLTGRAGQMQRPGAELGLVFNMGGMAVANYASVLEAVRA